jgi:hypothetical protein
VIYAEIGRLPFHLLSLVTQALDVGASTPILWAFEQREKLMAFYERASGDCMHAYYFRVDGVCRTCRRSFSTTSGRSSTRSRGYAMTSRNCSPRTASSSNAMSAPAARDPRDNETPVPMDLSCQFNIAVHLEFEVDPAHRNDRLHRQCGAGQFSLRICTSNRIFDLS